jgi:hypothetical protein
VTGTNLPEYWPDPKVPPIRWPEAPRESVYRPGMSRGEYFEALCKAEAGEFIFRTVRADSIYMIRPRAEEDDAMGSRYGFEDPYGHGQGDTGDKAAWSLLGTGEGFFTEYGSPDYRVVETPTVRVTINQEGLPTLVLKPEEFDSAMSAMASSLERKYGPPEQYHEKLRKQGYPIDDYLARKAGRGGVR